MRTRAVLFSKQMNQNKLSVIFHHFLMLEASETEERILIALVPGLEYRLDA